ncbi:hypothetical protein, partial [Micromonospora fulviviridis]
MKILPVIQATSQRDGFCEEVGRGCQKVWRGRAELVLVQAVTVVKGQDEVLSDGLELSSWADSRNPCWWSGDLR